MTQNAARGPRAADDFTTIRRRLEELRREPAAEASSPEPGAEYLPREAAPRRIDERHRARAEGAPPPWVPTIFLDRRD